MTTILSYHHTICLPWALTQPQPQWNPSRQTNPSATHSLPTSANSHSFPQKCQKNLTDTYTYGGPTEVYTYAYLPSQPLYFDLSPFPWAETTPHPSPGSPHINPQALSAPSSKPASTFATDPKADTVKRQRDLQKNRVAATKCRSKKKLYIQQLQSRFEDLSLAKRELQCQVQMLRNGLISLKEELVRHARCGDEPITSYIEKRRARCT